MSFEEIKNQAYRCYNDAYDAVAKQVNYMNKKYPQLQKILDVRVGLAAATAIALVAAPFSTFSGILIGAIAAEKMAAIFNEVKQMVSKSSVEAKIAAAAIAVITLYGVGNILMPLAIGAAAGTFLAYELAAASMR